MKITKIEIRNYRLLKELCLELEDELSLIVGKNNCGKTSILSILDKFLNNKVFSFEDFNLDFKKEFKELITNSDTTEENYVENGISLKLFIEYKEEDSLANIYKLMMDLNPNNNKIELLFEYKISFLEFKALKQDFEEFKTKELKKPKPKHKDLEFFLKDGYKKYFKIRKKTINPTDSDNFIDIEKENISLKNIINYQYIKANRGVSNKENDRSLSGLSSSIYENIEVDDTHQTKIDSFKDELHRTDDSLNTVYESIFESSIEKVKKFGGLNPNDTEIKITSTLKHTDFLKGNTTVLYKHNNDYLPEHYNGLGYMNLISMIFEIELLMNKFNRPVNENSADINLLFIEEPESHTHPQMQYIFIRNIKTLLRDEKKLEGKLQYIITTHSSHIVSESDFEDIKYLKRIKNENAVSANNLKDLEKEYNNDGKIQNYKFLKQYLTLHRAELFFADKAIFIEGDTERILLPAMMKKIDQEGIKKPLLSQNISIIETGAYSHIFEKFIDFIGIKSLIITDIDSAKGDRTKCKVSDSNVKITTNSSLKYFYGSEKIEHFKDKKIEDMILKKDSSTKKWEKDSNGYLLCIYQTEENGYHASSFEDSFFHINRQFILNGKNQAFKGVPENRKNGLKKIEYFGDMAKDAYELAENCVNKKPALAIEILLNSETSKDGKEFTNWKIPDYIKQGLLWLKD